MNLIGQRCLAFVLAGLLIITPFLSPHGPQPLIAQDGLEALADNASSEHLIVVIGAAGSAEYQGEFQEWSRAWRELSEQRQWKLTLIGGQASALSEDAAGETSEMTDRDALMQAIASHQSSPDRLWIVLLGHGTYSGNAAKFNLVGPDVSAKDLSMWLQPVQSPLVIINCSSASAPFLTELAGKDRVLLTATRAGSEINFARFGKYLAQSLSDLAADLDHDREVSLLEAFLFAAARTERFYSEEARLTTEHALLDDNGDRVGTSVDFFRGVNPIKKPAQGSVDGALAKRILLFSSPEAPKFSPALVEQREEIETQIDALRETKNALEEVEYLARLERLVLQLAAVYDAADGRPDPKPN